MMDMIDISVVVPVYNVEGYVGECLRSVMVQEGVGADGMAVECIVVDDCGTDGSMAEVRRTLEGYAGPVEFRIIERERNGGLSAARNTGIREARGRYVYFLDSDDVITPDCLRALYAAALRHPDAEIITGDFQTFPEKDVYKHLGLSGKGFPEYSEDRAWIRSVFLAGFPITAWNKLVRRDFIVDNELYFKEGIIHEDNHWQGMAYHRVRAVGFVEKVTYLYRMRPGSITGSTGAMARKVENLGVIYRELFGMQVEWDRPWAKWVVAMMWQLRKGELYGFDGRRALKVFRGLVGVVWRNESCPLSMRLAIASIALPEWMRGGRLSKFFMRRAQGIEWI